MQEDDALYFLRHHFLELKLLQDFLLFLAMSKYNKVLYLE